MASIERPHQRSWRLLTALGLATLVVASLETMRIPPRLFAAHPGLIPQALALDVTAALARFWPTVLGLLAWAGVAALPTWERRLGRGRFGVDLLVAALMIGASYRNLIRYQAFVGYAPALLLFVALGLFTVALLALPRVTAGLDRSGRLRWVTLAAALVAMSAAGGSYLVSVRYFLNHYPTLDLALLQLTHLLLTLGLWLGFELASPGRFAPGPRSAGTVALLLLAPVAVWLGWAAPARPPHRAFTALGRAEVVFSPYTAVRETPRAPVSDDLDAEARFARASRFPSLPADFDLSRHNVLLILGEATRFDQTSLGAPELATTPQLARLRDAGAISFSRAMAPASVTNLSIASILGMSYPSMLELETWNKAWTGRLRDGSPTVATLFQSAGYDTFWVGHNHRQCFSHSVLGVDRGFATRTLIDEGEEPDPALDRKIADRARHELEQRRGGARPFFGLVFFASPHSPYVEHDPARPRRTALDRYRQELTEMDTQIGRVLDQVTDTGLAASTIVIFMGDHGEEFGEHGGRYHKSTVYAESIHVPLLVRVPSLMGQVIDAPTSTFFVFPWLLLRGPPPLREAALLRLQSEIGPLLRGTEGAVVSELIGHERMLSALIYEDRKYVYDFIADRYQAYRIDRDPREQDDRFGLDPELTAPALAHVGAYREVRAARRRYQLRPDQFDLRGRRAGN